MSYLINKYKSYCLIFIKFTLILNLSSCGDSPFLSDETPEEIQNRDTLNSDNFEEGGSLWLRESRYQVRPLWRLGPFVADESKLLFLILDESGYPISPEYKVFLKIWMPTMGHGSFPIKVTEVGEGIFEAREIFFIMPGYWDIHFQLLDRENQLVEEVKWGLTL